MKVLPCGCHAVNQVGEVFSRITQSSQKGHQGIITKISDEWRKLRLTKTSSGYVQACIHSKSWRVNRLVALNFIENPYGHSEVQHKNGMRTDNRVENLKWGDPFENAQDRKKHGNTIVGSKSPNAKLTERMVQSIRELRKSGRTLLSLAQEFHVSKKLILLITQNRIWRHVA